MLPEWKLVRGETLKIRKKKATFAIIFISIFIIIGIVTFSYLRLKSSRESAAVSCIEEDIKKGSVSGKNREKLESYLSEEGQDVPYYFIKGYLDYQDAEYEMAIENFKLAAKSMTDTDDSFLKIYTYIFWNYALEEMGETEDLIQNSKMALTYMAQDKAYKNDMFLTEATVLTPEGTFLTLPVAELDLSYRHSIIPERGYLVVSAVLELHPGKAEEIRAVMEDLKEKRVSKQPLEYPSAGSTFKRPEGYFAGKLIQDAGLRGFQVGGAQVSEKHCGFVINRDHATSADICNLMDQVSEIVFEKFGVRLEAEVKKIGEF